MSLLAFRQVSKRFPDGNREIVVMDRVSFEVEVGETVGLLCSRRSGKTTLLKVAAGLTLPDEGKVLWEGRDLTEMSRDDRARVRREGGVAMVQGDSRIERSLPVLTHIAHRLYSSGLTMTKAEKRAMQTLDCLEATNLATWSTTELGVGERLMVELARAIVREPRLLLVDEPAVLPQPEDARAFYALLRSLPERVGCALLIASEEVHPLRGCKPMMSLGRGQLSSTTSRRKVIDFPSSPAGGSTLGNAS
jgi:ABC-type methionine transport system ATPase subunit